MPYEDYFLSELEEFDYTTLAIDMHQVARGHWGL